ncbi:MAG: amidohydrolase family protein [Acidimicrobiia bacterium]
MVEDLRPYCPKKYLADYDEFVRDIVSVRDWWLNAGVPGARLPGHYDSAARQRDMEGDGVVGEIIFHFSFNGELIPFVPTFVHADNPADLDLAAAGMHIYNQWLADFCNELPGRRAGLAHLPLWDIDAAVAELEWAAGAGLRGVNFPAMRESFVPSDDDLYEPLWAAAAAHGMPLTTHSGAVSPTSISRQVLLMIEMGGTYARRAIHRMIFAKIFDRHPGLKLVMTEQPGPWQKPLFIELDSAYEASVRNNANPDTGALTRNSTKGISVKDPGRWRGYAINTMRQEPLDRIPSEYFHTNIFVGASMLAPFEAKAAVAEGYDDAMMWGSDYPHPEGLRNPADTDAETSQFRRALRHTFQEIDEGPLRGMAGENAARCYGFDLDLLRRTADAIGAPTVADLHAPPQGPLVGVGGTGGLAFRKEAHWH